MGPGPAMGASSSQQWIDAYHSVSVALFIGIQLEWPLSHGNVLLRTTLQEKIACLWRGFATVGMGGQ